MNDFTFIAAPSLRVACDRCHKRKQRCMRPSTNDGNSPCRRCKEAGEECVYSPPCRLGRPSNKAKQQQRQQPYSKFGVSTSLSPPSHIRSLKSDCVESIEERNCSPDSVPGPSPGPSSRLGRPRRARWVQQRHSPSTLSINSSFSAVSALDSSVNTAISTPSNQPLDVYERHLPESTMTVEQAHAVHLQHQQHQHQHTDYLNSVSHGFILSTPDHSSMPMQITKMDSNQRTWNMPFQGKIGLHNGYTVHHQHQHSIVSDMPPAHGAVTPIKEEQVITPVTFAGNNLGWNDSIRNLQQHQQHSQLEKTDISMPLTPPPLLPAGYVNCVGENTSESIQSRFMSVPIDACHVGGGAGNTWSADFFDPYSDVDGKLMENSVITTDTLYQNYQLQLQLQMAASANIAGNGNWLAADSTTQP